MRFEDTSLTAAQEQRLATSYENDERFRRHMQALNWIGQHLERVNAVSGVVGNCLSEGVQLWRRKDGAAISPDDIRALQAEMIGQTNVVSKADDFTAKRFWRCDSSG